MIGIYKIISPSSKIYIGQSIDINRRFNDYKTLKQKNGQTKLYNSLQKYGFNNHLFEVIEECNIEELNKREIYWKKEFVNNVGWSKALFCFINDNSKQFTPEQIFSRSLKVSKTLYQYDLEGNFIKEFINAEYAIKEIGNGNANNINDCARGKYKATYRYQWSYIKYDKLNKYNIKPGNTNKWDIERRNKIKQTRLGEKRSKEYSEKIKQLKTKKVYQYDANDDLVNMFDSIKAIDGKKYIGITKYQKIVNKGIYYKGYKYENKKRLYE